MNDWNLALAALATPPDKPVVIQRICTDCGTAKGPDQFTSRYKICKPCRSKRVGKYNITDNRIIKCLRTRQTTGDLSRTLKVPVTTLHSRLDRMLADGQIAKDVVVVGRGRKAYWRSA